jgi:hypothetical protein
MDKLLAMARQLVDERKRTWDLSGDAIDVKLGESGRRQRVVVERDGDTYVFRSTVMSSDAVPKRGKKRHLLARRVWRRNAERELVSFGFDDERGVIGWITQPVGTLDSDELDLYVTGLAIECDRFEYLLTGEDAH